MWNCVMLHCRSMSLHASGKRKTPQPCAASATTGHNRLLWSAKCCMKNQATHRTCPLPSSSQHSTFLRGCGPKLNKQTLRRGKVARAGPVQTLAMVNVDLASPALLLGSVLIGCGVLLLQMRQMQKRVSKDGDIVVAAMISIVGGTLIFQGWRLDPLLLLSQAMTISIAFWYGLEAFKLRSEKLEEEDKERRELEKRSAEAGVGPGSTRAFADDGGRPSLPAGESGGIPWGAEAGGAMQERMSAVEYAQLYQQGMGPWGQGAAPTAGGAWGQPDPSQYAAYDYGRNPPAQVQVDPYGPVTDYPSSYSQQPAGFETRYVPDGGNYSFPYPPQPATQLPELPGGAPSSPYESMPPYPPETSYNPAAYQLPSGNQPGGPPDAYSQQPPAPLDRGVAPPERRQRPQGPGKGKYEVVDDWE